MQRFWAKKFGACGGRRAIVAAAAWRCWRHRCGFMCSCNRCNVYVTVAVTRVERVRWGQKILLHILADLDVLISAVKSVLKVSIIFDFCTPSNELARLRGVHPYPLCWRARLCCFCARIVEAWLRSCSGSLCYRLLCTPTRCAWLEWHSAVLLQSVLLMEDLLCANQGRM
jgi:hypothetical protein